MRQLCIILLAVSACCFASSARADTSLDEWDSKPLRQLLKGHVLQGNGDMRSVDSMYDDEIFNKLFPYDTNLPKQASPSMPSIRRQSNTILDHLFENRESSLSSSTSSSPKKKDLSEEETSGTAVVMKSDEKIEVSEPKESAVQQQTRPSLDQSPVDLNKAKSVAFNSREVRLMGPDKQEVEMKDDLATKVAVVFDNLRQETGQFLDQVNIKLDKGWTDFKQSVDKLVEQGKKQVSQL